MFARYVAHRESITFVSQSPTPAELLSKTVETKEGHIVLINGTEICWLLFHTTESVWAFVFYRKSFDCTAISELFKVMCLCKIVLPSFAQYANMKIAKSFVPILSVLWSKSNWRRPLSSQGLPMKQSFSKGIRLCSWKTLTQSEFTLIIQICFNEHSVAIKLLFLLICMNWPQTSYKAASWSRFMLKTLEVFHNTDTNQQRNTDCNRL